MILGDLQTSCLEASDEEPFGLAQGRQGGRNKSFSKKGWGQAAAATWNR